MYNEEHKELLASNKIQMFSINVVVIYLGIISMTYQNVSKPSGVLHNFPVMLAAFSFSYFKLEVKDKQQLSAWEIEMSSRSGLVSCIHFLLMPLRKAWIYLLPPKVWDTVLESWMEAREGLIWIPNHWESSRKQFLYLSQEVLVVHACWRKEAMESYGYLCPKGTWCLEKNCIYLVHIFTDMWLVEFFKLYANPYFGYFVWRIRRNCFQIP